MADLYASPPNKHEVAAWLVTGLALVAALKLHLLPALLAGLLVYELVHMLAPRLRLWRLSHDSSKIVAVAVLSTIIVLILTVAIVSLLGLLRRDAGSPEALLKQMIGIVDSARVSLPAWAVGNLPANVEELRSVAVKWLREHIQDIQQVGTVAGRAFVHILIGMIIGAMVALHEVRPREAQKPLARALTERVDRLGNAFRRIVFAQIRISALNTLLTGLYLAVVLPLFGIYLPFTKTMIAITFIVGLLPVIGNLISNTVIVIISLGHSVYVAGGSLAFLVIIHKLEYFVNAKIVGTQIRARAWGDSGGHAEHGGRLRHRRRGSRADLLRVHQGRTLQSRTNLAVPSFKLAILPVTPFQQNCSLLRCEATGKGAIVDPGGDLDRILATAKKLDMAVEKIFLTHGHIDHCGGTAELRRRLNVPVEGPQKEERFWIDQLPEQGRMFRFPTLEAFTPDRWLEEGDTVSFGDVTLEVKYCPGHTPGHIVFYSPKERLAIVGDVLFQGSIGRTDFPRGNHEALIRSIRDKLFPLGDDIAFIPGHGPMSTFGEERASNPFVGDAVAQ